MKLTRILSKCIAESHAFSDDYKVREIAFFTGYERMAWRPPNAYVGDAGGLDTTHVEPDTLVIVC